MKNRLLYILISAGILTISFSSCKKYLDELPDNRAELNTTDKIAKMLVGAYPSSSYVVVSELSSDNVDDVGPVYLNYPRFIEEIYKWQDITETNNDGIERVWAACYSAIASANAALQAIEEQGNPISLNAQRGEALLARAYNHWILVNMFAQNYSKKYSATDLGITYMTKGETTLNPKYQRNTVAEVYNNIKKDVEEGLPLINDASYANSSVAKYHFNRAAAYTFASRVALFMEDWVKVVEYATLALGENPSTTLRDYKTIASFAAAYANISREYNASSIKANFLIATASSSMGQTFGNYSTNNRLAHGGSIGMTETVYARQPFGRATSSTDYRIRAFVYSSTTTNKILFPHLARMFEYTDQVAGIGFTKGVYAPITSEEALLNRAEAYIHLKNYGAAITDMQIHIDNNTINNPATISEASINTWANSFAYFTPTSPTPKKKLNPDFQIEAGTQENMIQAILSLKRLQFIQTGMRWFDVKRYGIEITRREAPAVFNGTMTYTVTDNTLTVRDNRRAIQLPQDVINAGLTPNPR
ncbi:RagB/SusD family nutrient uptake outer membrane protein [Sphingobacterium detergens]|uniref:SusD-like starch-binding protein associating with outer membrane n=1 Tax=Sphingobacterium detergens TaxID=1145106 RepID=A0A420AXZ0_SPHD1|nr:RagB/SusD family nutrient uptake outer membrane protein [Sphingobacterium detergens]RKE49278.1 SusD-like starch-binding protein associating with outer membrane [Sphingobacterium detergens]